ncbi:class A beta-lactamase [Legionella taurinensis]|uniref:Beta-lactamase n=1 Tax=Legionella taurinensis TaxID=70611 RepID=A0A3A5L4J6_9GAMM|nr:class A beta-lactamase [Legionella taurinensis]RJT44194.1 class A beta-lactamase [Legionella taurinensis]RJT67095.1 class A beta-lactamase [Legionella taurinensis]STY26415.1 beta-lactamase [Legionella taurinensis]
MSFKRFSVFFFAIASLTLTAHARDELLSLQQKLAALEASAGGRLGIAAINQANGMTIQYHARQAFPLCSTSKAMSVAALLSQNMRNKTLLQEKIHYSKQDLVVHSPETEKHLADGMTLAELCEATITQSDNAALNLILKKIGGPGAVTAFARSIGDKQFRLDRFEPDLNTAIPGDPRDTTTPKAMALSLQKLTTDTLAAPERQLLITWLRNNTTGGARIRAGLPEGWVVGDKTGTGDYGTSNDIGVIWPPHCQPVTLAVYFTQPKVDATPNNDVIAAATRIVISAFAEQDPCLQKALAAFP